MVRTALPCGFPACLLARSLLGTLDTQLIQRPHEHLGQLYHRPGNTSVRSCFSSLSLSERLHARLHALSFPFYCSGRPCSACAPHLRNRRTNVGLWKVFRATRNSASAAPAAAGGASAGQQVVSVWVHTFNTKGQAKTRVVETLKKEVSGVIRG